MAGVLIFMENINTRFLKISAFLFLANFFVCKPLTPDVSLTKKQKLVASAPSDELEKTPIAKVEKKIKIEIASGSEQLESLLEEKGFFEKTKKSFWEGLFGITPVYKILLCDFDGFLFPMGSRTHDKFDKELSPIFGRLKDCGVLIGGLPLHGEKKPSQYLAAFQEEFGGFNLFLDINGPISNVNPKLLLRSGVIWNIDSSGTTKGRALRELLLFLKRNKKIDLQKVQIIFVDDSPRNLKSAIRQTADLGLAQLVPVHYVKPLGEAVDLVEIKPETAYGETLKTLWRGFLRELGLINVERALP